MSTSGLWPYHPERTWSSLNEYKWSLEKLSGNWFRCWVLEGNHVYLFFLSNSGRYKIPCCQVQRWMFLMCGLIFFGSFNRVEEILMSTFGMFFPIVEFGSVVGFQSVSFLFSYMIWCFLLFMSEFNLSAPWLKNFVAPFFLYIWYWKKCFLL